MSRDDGLLVEQLKVRDEAAVTVLIARYGDRLFNVALRITGSHQDAEEVVQDVLWGVFRKIHTFHGESKLSTWIYRIAVNAALNKRRGKRSELEVSLKECLPKFLPDGHREGHPDLPDWSQTPEEELLSRETQTILTRAIDELPGLYRTVLILRDVDGLSNEEVAEAVGESVAAVKSRLHRARMALREQLDRVFRPGPGRRTFHQTGPSPLEPSPLLERVLPSQSCASNIHVISPPRH